MLPWFLNDIPRLTRERDAIAELLQSAAWLVTAEWRFHDGGLAVEATIRVAAEDFCLRMQYPALFPDVPPILRPTNAVERWSSHQYGGIDGPLCLEWRTDNWDTDITGADMLHSAYRLLVGEAAPVAETNLPAVPAEHHVTVGQALRGDENRLRVWLPSELRERMGEVVKATGTFRYSFRSRLGSFVLLVREIDLAGEPVWRDGRVPDAAFKTAEEHGLCYVTSLLASEVASLRTCDDLTAALHANEIAVAATVGTVEFTLTDPSKPLVIVFDVERRLHAFVILNDGALVACSVVDEQPNSAETRTPSQYTLLVDARIGIVGLGSLGSKAAVSLARMGVRKFLLVDDDLVFPENLVRNALDWTAVIDHKVDAVAEAILRIVPDADIDRGRINLTAQESSAVVSSLLAKLGSCDLILDATANPRCLNVLAAAARAHERPLVWMHVYGGGRGGYMARALPGGPDAHAIRNGYVTFCHDHPPPDEVAVDYGLPDEQNEAVLTASDADVAIVAHHGVRFAVDALLPVPEYPFTTYLLGLSKWWIFSQPLETVPLEIAAERIERPPTSADAVKHGLRFLGEILGVTPNDNPST
jgi:hypothetical protein